MVYVVPNGMASIVPPTATTVDVVEGERQRQSGRRQAGDRVKLLNDALVDVFVVAVVVALRDRGTVGGELQVLDQMYYNFIQFWQFFDEDNFNLKSMVLPNNNDNNNKN